MGDLFALLPALAVFAKTLVAVVVGKSFDGHLLSYSGESLSIIRADTGQHDLKSVSFELSDFEGKMIAAFLQDLYTVSSDIFEHFFIFSRQRNALNGRGTFVFETSIANLSIVRACRLFEDIEQSPGTKIIFFDIKKKELSSVARLKKRNLFYIKALYALLEIKRNRGVGVGICFHGLIIAKN